jgi:hypothetical protein
VNSTIAGKTHILEKVAQNHSRTRQGGLLLPRNLLYLPKDWWEETLSLQPKLAYRKRNQSTKPKQYKKRQWWCCPGIDLVIEVAITSIAMCEAVTTSYDVKERSKQISIHKGISVKPNKQVKTKNGFGNMFLQNKLHITSNHKILDIVHHKLSKILKVPPTLTAK